MHVLRHEQSRTARVGQILAKLDEVGQADNTIIVFTSDHGDMMGDHGLMLKGFIP